MALHDTFKTATLRHPNAINIIALGKHIHTQDITLLDLERKIAKFTQSLNGRCIVLAKVPSHRLIDPNFLLIIKPKLDCAVTIFLNSLTLYHSIRTCKDYCYRNSISLGIVN